MKMKDVIDGVSKIYREKRNDAYGIQQELNSVRKKLLDAKKMNLNILLLQNIVN